MNHFESIPSFIKFTFAKGFVRQDDGSTFVYQKNPLERIGHILSRAILVPVDLTIKNITNPIFVLAASLFAIGLLTLIFYPALFPGILIIAAIAKFAFYAISIAMVVGVAARNISRLNNEELMQAWDNKEIAPLRIGAR